MRTLRISEWADLYQDQWRPKIAHLTKEERSKMVRMCKGKAIYDSYEEAGRIVSGLPLRGNGTYPHAYTCLLCAAIHIGNTKKRREYK